MSSNKIHGLWYIFTHKIDVVHDELVENRACFMDINTYVRIF